MKNQIIKNDCEAYCYFKSNNKKAIYLKSNKQKYPSTSNKSNALK